MSLPVELASLYERLDRDLPVVDGAALYRDLVVPNGNAHSPVHGWYHLKESFSSRFLAQIVLDLSRSHSTGLHLLDPFCGAATSIVSAQELPNVFAEAVGIEVNPFLHFVASTKTTDHGVGAAELMSFLGEVLAASQTLPPGPTPGLSTFSNNTYFPPAVLADLLKIRSAIEARGDDACAPLARLALAATVEPVSMLRRDGRALRYEPTKTPPTVRQEFLRRGSAIAGDLVGDRARSVVARILLADGTQPARVLSQDYRADLVVFSPPYPNNIDYTEVYKLEAWLLGFITSDQEFREARLATVRSHPSILTDEPDAPEGISDLLHPLLAAIPADRYQRARRQVVVGYFADMHRTLTQLRSILSPDGYVVYVVGNSLHGSNGTSLLIAPDILMASIGERVGYKVERVAVARRPERRSRDYAWLRESVVLLRADGR